MSLTEKLIVAALTGAVLGAAGCSSTTENAEGTTPAAAEKASCKGAASCNGAAPAPAADGTAAAPAEGGEKASCKGASSCSGAK